jgi:hypothetical protein
MLQNERSILLTDYTTVSTKNSAAKAHLFFDSKMQILFLIDTRKNQKRRFVIAMAKQSHNRPVKEIAGACLARRRDFCETIKLMTS